MSSKDHWPNSEEGYYNYVLCTLDHWAPQRPWLASFCQKIKESVKLPLNKVTVKGATHIPSKTFSSTLKDLHNKTRCQNLTCRQRNKVVFLIIININHNSHRSFLYWFWKRLRMSSSLWGRLIIWVISKGNDNL